MLAHLTWEQILSFLIKKTPNSFFFLLAKKNVNWYSISVIKQSHLFLCRVNWHRRRNYCHFNHLKPEMRNV